jgi:hypothetical protein
MAEPIPTQERERLSGIQESLTESSWRGRGGAIAITEGERGGEVLGGVAANKDNTRRIIRRNASMLYCRSLAQIYADSGSPVAHSMVRATHP